jgi:uncharacterized protein (DUF305 family)
MRISMMVAALLMSAVTPLKADDSLHQPRAASSASPEAAQPTQMRPGHRPQTRVTMEDRMMHDPRQGTGIGMIAERSVAGCMQLGQMPRGPMTMNSLRQEGDVDPATQTLRAAYAVMEEKIDIAFSDETDVDFIKIMVLREKASLDMVRTAVGFARDPEVRNLADNIIKAKEGNLAQMHDWLKKRGR